VSFQADYYEVRDRYYASEDLNFQAGDSPVVLDVEASLGTYGRELWILCKSNSGGSGDILVEISSDGTNYGDQFTIFNLQTRVIKRVKVSKVRITHSGSDAGYQVYSK